MIEAAVTATGPGAGGERGRDDDSDDGDGTGGMTLTMADVAAPVTIETTPMRSRAGDADDRVARG